MSAEAMRQEDPRWGELVALLGWPWKLALALTAFGTALLCLPRTGFVGPAVAAWNGEAALACMTTAALLALCGSLYTLRALLRSTTDEPAPAGMEAQELIGGLRRLLEEQRLQVHEATGAASRAVATAAQLSGLASSVEKQFRQTLEQVAPSGAAAAPMALPEQLQALLGRLESACPEAALARLESCAQQVEAVGDRLLTLPALARQMEENNLHLQQSAAAVAEAAGMLQTLPAAALRMASGTERLEAATQVLAEQSEAAQLQPVRLSQQMEGLLEEAVRRRNEVQGDAVPAGRLEELVRSLGGHVERVLRNEATLGDAARYLTETTDRFAGGLAALETHVVRLQAMISIIGSREAEAEPLRDALAAFRQQVTTMAELTHSLEAIQHRLGEAQPLPLAMRATLEQLGAVEADAAQLLQEAAAMPQQALPPAFASRATKLLQAVRENIRHLHAAAPGASPAAA